MNNPVKREEKKTNLKENIAIFSANCTRLSVEQLSLTEMYR